VAGTSPPVGGEGTGLHPDLIVIDDAATAADAQSDVERTRVTCVVVGAGTLAFSWINGMFARRDGSVE
jgi:hypothetical protein